MTAEQGNPGFGAAGQCGQRFDHGVLRVVEATEQWRIARHVHDIHALRDVEHEHVAIRRSLQIERWMRKREGEQGGGDQQARQLHAAPGRHGRFSCVSPEIIVRIVPRRPSSGTGLRSRVSGNHCRARSRL